MCPVGGTRTTESEHLYLTTLRATYLLHIFKPSLPPVFGSSSSLSDIYNGFNLENCGTDMQSLRSLLFPINMLLRSTLTITFVV